MRCVMPKQILNVDNVRETVEQLQSEGYKPTFKRIIERLGGSYGTLTAMRKEHPEIFWSEERRVDSSSQLEKENFNLKMELTQIRFEARIDVLEREKLERDRLIDKLKKSFSDDMADMRDLWLDAVGQARATKTAKTLTIDLHDQYPEMTYKEINDRLFDEGFRTRSGGRIGSGQISKWINSK